MFFGEIHCMCKIIWPAITQKENTNLLVVRWLEDVSTVKSLLLNHTGRNQRSINKAIEL